MPRQPLAIVVIGGLISATALTLISANYDQLSIAEQVIGRQRRHQIQVLLQQSLLDDFLGALVADLGDIDIHYWVVPVLAGGRLTRSTRALSSEGRAPERRPRRD